MKLQSLLSIIAFLASFVATSIAMFSLLRVCISFRTYADPVDTEDLDYETAKITSIVTLSIVLIIYTYFWYSTGRWFRLTVGLPKYISERIGRNRNIPVRDSYFATFPSQ